MNKTIFTLGALICFTLQATSQTWNFSNEPQEDTNSTLYLVDTTSTNYSSLTGANQTWDYSMLGGYLDNTRNLSVTNADLYMDIFPNAAHVLSIPGFMNTAYVYETNNDKFAHGFEFELPDLGIVQFILEDFQKQLQFPMTLGDAFEDNFTGTLVLLDEPNAAEGSTWVSADATGTLLLANDVSHTNVLRIHSLDTIYADIVLSGLPIPTSATIIREQFDYLKPGTSNFPLFTHATLTVLNPLIGQIKIGVVLSSENPTFFVNTPDYLIAATQVYPNPSLGIFSIQLPNVNEQAHVVVTDLAGSVVFENPQFDNNQHIDLNTNPAGVYFVNIRQKGSINTIKLLKK